MKRLKWLAARWAILVEVTHTPSTAFTRNLDGPSYLLPLIALGAVFAALSLLQAPWTIEWARGQMQAAGTPDEQVAYAVQIMRQAQWLSVGSVPILLLLKWVVFAALLWLTLWLFSERIGFSRVLTVVAYAYLPFLFRDIFSLLSLALRGAAILGQPDTMSIGLNLLLPRMPPPWQALAGHINIFELWFLLLLTVGIAKLGAIRWQKALAATLSAWLFVFSFQAGIVLLGYSAQASLGQ